MKGYTKHTEIIKEVLDQLKVGDLVKVNDWKKPMKIKGVSENYAVMTQKQFKDTYYSVIEKKPWDGVRHNAMIGGHFHCGKDFWLFGVPIDFDYNFEDEEAVGRYLQTFESGLNELSHRNAIPILELHVKTEPEDPCQPCHNALQCLEWAKAGMKAKCIHARYFKKHYASGRKKIIGAELLEEGEANA